MTSSPAATPKGSRPTRAMVLAAGRGERMRLLTDELPKPLIPVRGATMLDRVLDRLAAAGVTRAVVNSHHLADRIETHLAGRSRPKIVISPEAELLDTGGGVRAALGSLGKAPFFVLNGDVVWLDGPTPALERLAAAWDESRMDALLLVHATTFAFGYEGRGDFLMDPEGRLRRRAEREIVPFVFAGIQIFHPRLFEGTPGGPFSLNRLYDKAGAAGRLWGLRHDGEWYHIGTPEALRDVEDELHYLSSGAVQR
jgi:MurNAc alpha-1-phosphate uridylyltransferase